MIAGFHRTFVEPRIIESAHLTLGPFEDWSKVRSPGRARRRRKRGHRQNIRVYYKPSPDFVQLPNGDLVGHPATVAKLRERVRVDVQRRSEKMLLDAFLGSPAGS